MKKLFILLSFASTLRAMQQTSLENLPKDIKPLIISQLVSASTPEQAAQNLKKLALVNKNFSTLAKDPKALLSIVLQVVPNADTPEQAVKYLKALTLLNPALTPILNDTSIQKKLYVPYIRNFIKKNGIENKYINNWKLRTDRVNYALEYLSSAIRDYSKKNIQLFALKSLRGKINLAFTTTEHPSTSDLYQAAAQALEEPENQIRLIYAGKIIEPSEQPLDQLNIPKDAEIYCVIKTNKI